jgi:hypothetical protein
MNSYKLKVLNRTLLQGDFSTRQLRAFTPRTGAQLAREQEAYKSKIKGGEDETENEEIQGQEEDTEEEMEKWREQKEDGADKEDNKSDNKDNKSDKEDNEANKRRVNKKIEQPQESANIRKNFP